MYSNSNYVLLALIIERITNTPFHQWMREQIFLPLNLNDTYVDETNQNFLPKIATPYNEIGKYKFAVAENTSKDIGASNIYTTANDLSRWMGYFLHPKKGWEQEFDLMLTRDTLNNGEKNHYAFGVFVEELLGNKRIQHSGGEAFHYLSKF
ncbi:MAG: beta-lactamase family protein [Flavobacteriales bacterium]|nr:beta-lactamase family protein [Flavobacteriales bacterium]